MIQEYIIRLNGKPFIGEDINETYRGGDSWSGNSFHTSNPERNNLVFGENGCDGGYIIVGTTNLKSYLDKIIRFASANNIGVRSLDIACAVCGGSGGVETGENEVDACSMCSYDQEIKNSVENSDF